MQPCLFVLQFQTLYCQYVSWQYYTHINEDGLENVVSEGEIKSH